MLLPNPLPKTGLGKAITKINELLKTIRLEKLLLLSFKIGPLIKSIVDLVNDQKVKDRIEDIKLNINNLKNQINQIKGVIEKFTKSIPKKPVPKEIPKIITGVMKTGIEGVSLGIQSSKTMFKIVESIDFLAMKIRTITDKVVSDLVGILEEGKVHQDVLNVVNKIKKVLDDTHKVIKLFGPEAIKLLDQINIFIEKIYITISKPPATETKLN